jgi:hypothetical protein
LLNFPRARVEADGGRKVVWTALEIQREGKQTRAQGREMKELGDKGNQKVENFGISA